MGQSTGQVDGGGDQVLGRCEDGLDGVKESFEDRAEDVEDGGEEGGDGVCYAGHGCRRVVFFAGDVEEGLFCVFRLVHW